MAVENWIDDFTKMIGNITVQNKPVKSYSLYLKNEYPSSIKIFPSALTFIDGVNSQLSGSGPSVEFWSGFTEFHLFANVDPGNYPNVLPWFKAIRNAFGSHVTLGGKIAYCLLVDNPLGIEGPLELTYGSEAPHLGLVAHWRIKEHISDEFTFGG
jgi:hypothetical protein